MICLPLHNLVLSYSGKLIQYVKPRRSWNKFERVRKSQGLTGRKRKVPVNENSEVELVSKRRHGCTASSLNIDKEL